MTVVATKARGAKVEIGNAITGPFTEIKGITSGPSWEGFSQQILEVWPQGPNCIFNRNNIINVNTWNPPLPPLP